LLDDPELYDQLVKDIYNLIVEKSPFVTGYINDRPYEMIDIDYDGDCRFDVVEKYFEHSNITDKWKDSIHDDALDMIRDKYLVYGYHDNPEIP
jgi:hypothetical protein